MPTNKPTDLGRWGAVAGAEVVNPSAQVATPPSGKQDIGWEFDTGAGTGEKPPVQWENWKGFVGYLWNKFQNDLTDALQLQGFEVSAQDTPDDTVAVKAGRFRIGGASISVAADPTFGPFDAPYSAYDRVDLLYVSDGGALSIERGDLLHSAASALAATQEFKLDTSEGDQTGKYLEGQTFTVSDASANNGDHVVKDTRYSGGNTFIRTVGALSNSTGGQIAARYDGKMVVAAVTIQSGGSTVIGAGDIEDVRAWQNNPSFSGDDAAFGGSKVFDGLQKFAAGVALLMGGTPYRVRQGAGSTSGDIEWKIGINCDPDSFDSSVPELKGTATSVTTGYPRGVFSTADGIILFRLVTNGTNRIIQIYSAVHGWTDGNDIALTQMASFVLNAAAPQWKIYDGTALEEIATQAYVDQRIGCSGDVKDDATHDANDFVKNENLIYRGTSAFLTGQSSFQIRKDSTGIYHFRPPSTKTVSDYRGISFIPDNVGVWAFTPSTDGDGDFWAISFYTYTTLPALTAADTPFLLTVFG